MSEGLKIREALASRISEESPGSEWLIKARQSAKESAGQSLAQSFPQLPRRVGTSPLAPAGDSSALLIEGAAPRLDLRVWTRADAAGNLLLAEAVDAGLNAIELRQLFDHGDSDERRAIFRAMAWLPFPKLVLELLGEAQRTNHQDLFEAAWCESTVAASMLSEADFNRMVLKLAFAGLELSRVFGAYRRANAELGRMLSDFAQEREAAGREVWPDTLRILGHAPYETSIPRLLGGLENGHDPLRLAAVDGLVALGDARLLGYLESRLGREAHPRIRRALQEAIATFDSNVPETS